jgi:hypothetical protein
MIYKLACTPKDAWYSFMTFLHLVTRIWWHIWILGWWGWGLVETGDLWLLEGDENGAVGIRIDRGKT